MFLKVIFSIFILSYSLTVASQTSDVLDHSYLKCLYYHTWQFDTLENIVRDDLIILEIGKNISKTYSYYTYQSDSLDRAPDGAAKRAEMTRRMAKEYLEKGTTTNFIYRRLSTYLYKNYPEGKITVIDNISLRDYIYEDSLNGQQWQLVDSIKTILDYSCQKAQCNFRGRQWTAWFAEEIPVSDGPWKFGGLPGLIMEVYDQKQQYYFRIKGIEKGLDAPIEFDVNPERKKIEQTNRRDFLKAKDKYLMNTVGYIEMETGIDLSGDTPTDVKRHDLIERDYK